MVGQLLKERRQAMGFSQIELARRAGSSQRQVSRLENDEDGVPRRETLERFGAVLGITMGEWRRAAGILNIEDDKDPPPRQLALLSLSGDEEFEGDAIVAYVEGRPGRRFQEQLRRAREERTYSEYVEFCVSIFRAWESNSDLGIKALQLGRRTGTDGL